jgi:hypothetical protein
MTGETYETSDYTTSTRTGWTGWITFAAIMMMISGGLNALYGLIGIVNDQWVVWTNRGSLYLDITQWGWVHLIVGLVVLFSGIGLLSGNMFARVIGIIAVAISLMSNFFFIPAYPLWALIVITIDVLVIWALTAHGKEMRES